jgi:Ca-activated chloride channel family protein
MGSASARRAFSIVLLTAACGGSPSGGGTTATPSVPRSTFAEVNEDERVEDVDWSALAFRGIPEEAPTEALGSRLAVRPLEIPRPGRGGTRRFSFEDGKRGWITALPSSELLTTPTYGDGKLFLGGGFASHRFFAFDAFRGDLAWSLAAPDGGPTAAIYDRDRVLFNTESCTIFVANADTGELIWKRWLGDPLMSQPVIGGDLVMSAYPANGAHVFGAFDVDDGDPRWSFAIPADVIQAPQVRGEDVFFATMDGSVFRVRHRDGHVHWRKDLAATSAVWVDGERMLLTRRVDVRGEPHEEAIVVDARRGEVVRTAERVAAPYLRGNSRDRRLATGQAGAWGTVPHGARLGLQNVASGWAYQGSSPAVVDGRAYAAVGPEIVARDVSTGEIVWRRRDGSAGDAQTVSPPAIVGSQIVYGTVDGHLYFGDIDTGITLRAYDLGEPIVFQPIVAEGWVYVATGAGNVIGLEVGDPQLDGWHMWGGNAQHAGLVDDVVDDPSEVSPALLASLDRPGRGTLRLGGFVDELAGDSEETATDANGADSNAGRAPDPEEPRALLRPQEQPDLPQIGVRVDADVSGVVARVAVTQSFENPHDRAIEAVYLFPLPVGAAVDDMEMHVGTRVVRAQIRRKEQARREYAEARASGRRAALLEQEREDLFVQRVANVGPGETVRVRLTYVQTLPFVPDREGAEGAYELVFPMSAPRRFDPANPSAVVGDPREVREADAVDLSVRLRPGMPLLGVSSPTHAIATTQLGDGARVALEEGRREADRDFVLRYRVGGEHPEAALFAHRAPVTPEDDGAPNGYFGLVVQPPQGASADADAAAREITFVIDRSSSMRGRAMEQAQAVVRETLATMRADERFSIVSFGDVLERLDDSPLPVNDETRARASRFVEGLRAVGATRMVPAIEDALRRANASAVGERARLPIVVLLTDGWIGNEREVLGSIVSALGVARVYPIGLGSSPNRFVLGRAAELGRGRAIFGALSEDGAALASRFVDLVDRPTFTDVSIDWGGLDVHDVYPRRLPDLFAGQPLIVHGRFARGGEATVKIRGTRGGRRFERAISVRLPEGAHGGDDHAVHRTLWARAAIGDRMERMTFRDDPALIQEVTTLGLQHRLVTRWTSFVAVDATPRPEAEEATISPARSLPGDPEIRIPAPADARAVTVLLPFGETLAAVWEPEIDRWTARFLVPGDAEEGSYPIEIAITHADGRLERARLWYTVDASAPMLAVEAIGDVRPGATITLRARQIVTDADLSQVGHDRGWLTDERAQLLQDVRRVEARIGGDDGGEVVDLATTGPGTWEARVTVPSDVRDTFSLTLVVVDLAANVREQPVSLEVAR